jgi:hypothetical protein
MSKSSSKQRYEQLKEWLNYRSSTNKKVKRQNNQTRLDYYTDKEDK